MTTQPKRRAGAHSAQTAGLARMSDRLRRETEAHAKTRSTLKQSKRHCEALMRLISEGSWSWEPATGLFTASARWKQLLGYRGRSSPATFDAVAALIHPEDREAALASIRTAVRQRRTFTVGYRLRRSDGSYARIVSRGTVVAGDQDGAVACVVGADRESHGGNGFLEAIRAGEVRFRMIADRTYDWEFWLSPEKVFLYHSPSAARILGRPISRRLSPEVLFRRHVYPPDAAPALNAVLEALNGKSMCDLEYRIIRPSGELRWIHLIADPVFDGDGKYLGLRGSQRDVTEKRLAEEKREELARAIEARSAELASALEAASASGRQLRNIIESLSEGVVMRSSSGETIAMNSSAGRILGLSGEQLVGKEPFPEGWRAIHEDGSPFRHELHPGVAALRDGVEVRGVVMGVDKPDGSQAWVSLSAVPILDERTGNVTAVVATATDITAERETRQELREQGGLLRIITEGINEVFWMRTPGLDRTVYVSGAFEGIWGVSRKELYGNPRKYLNAIHPDDLPSYDAVLRERHLAGRPYIVDYRIIPPSGREVWIRERGFPIPNAEGGVEYMVGSCMDFTTIKEADEKVRRSEDQIRRLNASMEDQIRSQKAEIDTFYETAPAGLCVLDRNLRYVRINKMLADLNGRSIDDHLGKTVHDVIPLFAESVMPRLKQILESGVPIVNVEVPWTIPGDRERKLWCLSSWFPLRDSSGAISGISAVVQDITALKSVEMTLRESEERLRILTDGIDAVFWMATPGLGRLIHVSGAYEKIWGMSSESLFKSPESFLTIVHPEDLPRLRETLARNHRAGTAYVIEYRIRREGGGFRRIREHGHPSYDERGSLRYMMGLSVDVTDYGNPQEA